MRPPEDASQYHNGCNFHWFQPLNISLLSCSSCKAQYPHEETWFLKGLSIGSLRQVRGTHIILPSLFRHWDRSPRVRRTGPQIDSGQ